MFYIFELQKTLCIFCQNSNFSFVSGQAFAHLSDKLVPLVDGVCMNKQHWLEIAESKRQAETCTNHDRTTSASSSDNEEISEQADQ